MPSAAQLPLESRHLSITRGLDEEEREQLVALVDQAPALGPLGAIVVTTLVAPQGPPVRCTAEVRPIAVLTAPSGRRILDLGQNLSGRLRIRVTGRAGQTVTIRHLLTHTSGLRDYIGLMTLAGLPIDGHTTARQALDAIVRQKALNFEPGAEHLYSNSGYFLLSQIVLFGNGLIAVVENWD